MNRIRHWIEIINNHRSRSFWIALTLLIIAALGMRVSSTCLKMEATPLAIIDLELAFDQAKANSIKELWITHECSNALSISSNALEAAVVNTFLDFVFILAYTWFIIVLITLSQVKDSLKSSRLTLLGSFAAIIAACLDIIENLSMLIFLKIGEITSLLFAIPATIKFAIIVSLAFWILLRLSIKLFSKMVS